MKILKPLINQFQSLLENSNIHEEIDIKISSIESFDYQINNLVKYQNHRDIEKILNDVEQLALNIEIIDSFEITEKNFFNFILYSNFITLILFYIPFFYIIFIFNIIRCFNYRRNNLIFLNKFFQNQFNI